MKFTTVLSQVIVLFAILIVGFIARRKNILNKETNKGFCDFLFNITIPFTIISSLNQSYSKYVLINAGYILALSFFIHVLSIFIGKLFYFKCDENARKILWFTAVFSNCAFMGYPITESIFGKIGFFYASIYNIGFTLFVWTFGQVLFSGKKDMNTVKSVIINPAMIGIIIGMVIFISQIKLPIIILKVLDMIGSMTTPLSMIIVGSMLAEVKIKEMFSGYYIYYSAFVRLFFLPIVILLLLKFVGISGNILGICVILTAMPAASFSVIFAEKFNADAQLASRCVLFSTAISIISIPIILSFI